MLYPKPYQLQEQHVGHSAKGRLQRKFLANRQFITDLRNNTSSELVESTFYIINIGNYKFITDQCLWSNLWMIFKS
jgi:hypothetical protein